MVQRRGVVAVLAVASAALLAGAIVFIGMAPAPVTDDALPPPEPVADAAPPRDPHVPAAEPEVEERDPIPTDPDSRAAFEERYPDQAAATGDTGPDGDRWALLIGINEHVGGVSDNYVSREDAETLREILLRAGWADERIVLMTDRDATGAMMREGVSWLARKADDDATVVFHYSGHSQKEYGDAGAVLDVALWPTDDDFLWSDDLAALLAEVRHDQLWANFATCNAEGLHDAGLGGPGRLVTYSSRTAEKSYEDPAAGHSVWGSFLLDHALLQGAASGDGQTVSIQQAFAYAAPQATTRTLGQVPYGPQTPVLVDDLGEPFLLHLDGEVEAADLGADKRVAAPIG